jgi:hypothetical protein
MVRQRKKIAKIRIKIVASLLFAMTIKLYETTALMPTYKIILGVKSSLSSRFKMKLTPTMRNQQTPKMQIINFLLIDGQYCDSH